MRGFIRIKRINGVKKIATSGLVALCVVNFGICKNNISTITAKDFKTLQNELKKDTLHGFSFEMHEKAEKLEKEVYELIKDLKLKGINEELKVELYKLLDTVGLDVNIGFYLINQTRYNVLTQLKKNLK